MKLKRKKLIDKFNKIKKWFSEKISEGDKYQVKLIQGKKGNTLLLSEKSGYLTTDTLDIKKIIKEYY